MDVATCCKRLDGDNAYTTVKTVMERLTVKGHLQRRKEARSYVYWPVMSRSEAINVLADQSARELVSGFGSLAVSNFVDTVRTNPDQLAQLMSLLENVTDENEPR